MAEAVVVASCPDVHQDAVGAVCKALGFQKAFGRAGDMVDSLSGKDWVAKWEAKVVMATVTKVQTLGKSRAKIICISGGKHCDFEMARQPKLVKAIRQELEDDSFRIRVEWMDYAEFHECYGTGGNVPGKVEEKPGKAEHQQGKGKGKPNKGKGKASEGTAGEGKDKPVGGPGKGENKDGRGEAKAGKGAGVPGKGEEGEPNKGRGKPGKGESRQGKGESRPGKGEGKPDKGEGERGQIPTPQAVFLCNGCGRVLATNQALQQHWQSKPACVSRGGGVAFLCEGCDQDFATERALRQHWQSKPACATMQGKSGKAESKQGKSDAGRIESKLAEGNTLVLQEVRLGGQVVFLCKGCDADFASEQALQQHWQSKPACKSQGGWAMVACSGCGRLFATEHSLLQHWKSKPECNSGAHDGIFVLDGPAICRACYRVFDSDSALQQHLKATGHGEVPAGPRDAFADWVRLALQPLVTFNCHGMLSVGHGAGKTSWPTAIDRAIQLGRGLRHFSGLGRAALQQQTTAEYGHTLQPGELLRELQRSVDSVYGLLFQWACALRRQGADFDYNSGEQLRLPCDCGAALDAAQPFMQGWTCTGCGSARRWVRAVVVANVPTKTRQAVGQLDLEFKRAFVELGLTTVHLRNWCPFLVVGAAAARDFMEELGGTPVPQLLPGVVSRIPRAGPLRELDDLALEEMQGGPPPELAGLGVRELKQALAAAGADVAAEEAHLRRQGVSTKEELVAYVQGRLAELGAVACHLCARRFPGPKDLDRHLSLDHSREATEYLRPEVRAARP